MQNKTIKRIYTSIIFLLIAPSFLIAQQTNLDCKLVDIGVVRQTLTNMATFSAGWTDCIFYYPFTQNIDWDNLWSDVAPVAQPGWSEYPKGSNCIYGDFAPWIGAKVGTTVRVTTGGPCDMDPWPGEHLVYELYPTSEPWDTIWVVNRGQTVDIPYWPNYTGISDQDFVCRFNDYTVLNLTNHVPMDVDVIQVTYSWISLEFLVHQYWIVPRKTDLKDVYFGYYGKICCGCASTAQMGTAIADEYGWYDEQRNVGFEEDLPGHGDDDCVSGPIAFKIIPDQPESELQWTWYDGLPGRAHPNTDPGKYQWMTQGLNHVPIQQGDGNFIYSTGPFQLPVGDTLHLTVGQIYGKGLEGVYKNLDRLYELRDKDYRLPAPPPNPPLRIEIANHQIILGWEVQPGDIDPETYVDNNRGDGVTMPFEGYRVYKSTVSSAGPWTLLADYDLIDNGIGNNNGLTYSFTDMGLLNNFEYYYTVTAYARPDSVIGIFQLESSQSANVRLAIPGTAIPKSVGKVAVVPNPYRGDAKYYSYQPPWEKVGAGGSWTEESRRIQFINLPSPCRIKIYTVSGIYVNTINHDDPQRGFADWNLTSFVGQAISSGVYLFSVEDLKTEEIQTGKFVIIK